MDFKVYMYNSFTEQANGNQSRSSQSLKSITSKFNHITLTLQ